MGDIEITRHGATQVLRFNRPEKKNALTAAMYTALADALEAGDRDPAITAHAFLGGDGVFSAGNDIGEVVASASGDGGVMQAIIRFVRLLPLVEKPMLAGVDGLAVGIGTTLLFHCDFVLASERATFRTPFLDLGLVPEAASSLLGPRRIGHPRAFELLVLGASFDAERMREAGLVNAVVPADELAPRILAVGEALAQKPPEALAAARRLMRGDPTAVSAAVEAEAAIFARQLRSPEAAEAFRAFIEKRRPDFARIRGA